MARFISMTEAKKKLPELTRRNQRLGESFVIVKDSKPVSALIPFGEYESFLETLDILETEPDIVKKLKKAESEIKAGKYARWKGKRK
ncbi:MAG: type II toxin-antitoxin system prevent-host-death family antitoxin [Planctomycetota bacterium]